MDYCEGLLSLLFHCPQFHLRQGTLTFRTKIANCDHTYCGEDIKPAVWFILSWLYRGDVFGVYGYLCSKFNEDTFQDPYADSLVFGGATAVKEIEDLAVAVIVGVIMLASFTRGTLLSVS